MLEWVLRYLRLGWPVFPLQVRGKLPMIAGGRGSLDATLNESQARQWWEKWPQANIGLATGHRFFAIDIDLKKGGDETWDSLRAQYASLPETIEQVTGTGGRHILYVLPDFPVKNSTEKLGPGLDVRGQGGYIVACPSIHPETKRQYDWDGLTDIEEQRIAAAPAWLLRLLEQAEQRKPAENAQAPAAILEGKRNDTLFRIASRVRRQGFSEAEILALLESVNQARCHPPLPDAELRTIAGSAARYVPDARASVFPGASPAVPEASAPELAITQSDIEAAAAALMAANDVKGAFDLARDVAKLPAPARALIAGKFRAHFKDHFSIRLFEQAMGLDSPVSIAGGPPGDDGYDHPGGDWPDLTKRPHTDSGNGERVVMMFRERIRYCVEMQKWLVWDGWRWAVDDRGAASQLAKQMCRELYKQALGDAPLTKWARTSESQERIQAALKRAATEPGIPISAKELDQQVYLLNCLNGVLDLRTGELLAHDRNLLITKLCNHEYNPRSECPRFFKFLEWAMGQNPEADRSERTTRIMDFLQRAFGYSLTADVSEKCAFIFYGSKGNNGKTTLLTVFRTILGEYSAQISIDTLMTQRGSADAALRADMADLRGARFVTTSEVEKEHKLSEGKLKYITAGMGEIKSCRKYENPIEFPATHKLCMDCNHRPVVRGTDEAIWSRLKCIPFEVRIDKSDPDFDLKLLEKLVAEAPGILAWAVRGAMRWAELGLGDPPEISQAGIEWREHDDPLKEFLEDCCEIGADQNGQTYWVRSAELTAAYSWWCKRNHERFPLGREHFVERIHSKGFSSSRSRRSTFDQKQMRTIEGLRLREEIVRQMRADQGTSLME